ncbi:hypothetical protein [Kushneria aurantia]|uniref:Replication initiation factor n=1 Tax=Kushneria aurantia TaxID=504092 RepID=A0ABV6G2R0_9GAMM|nr:hypothetical protein [Kushneria aurantia]
MSDWDRYSISSLASGEADPLGNLFLSPAGQVDLSNIRILHAGIDTIRQTYSGVPCRYEFDRLREAYQSGEGAIVNLAGSDFIVGAVGQDSGYRYKLQNNDLGVIVLFRSRHAKLDTFGSHVKIELSPHFIYEHGANGCQTYMDTLACHLLARLEHQSCAVHLAIDVQGWTPPRDFLDRFTTRSRHIYTADGINRMELDQGTIATGYGDRETVTFGRAASLQLTTYNKSKQALATDKLDFWQGIWSTAAGDDPCTALYDPDQPVQRIECRFHQSVLADYARGEPHNPDTGECPDPHKGFARFIDVVPHLTGLWRSALQSQRLDHSRDLIDPAWQLFRDDPRFHSSAPDFLYKRRKKTPGQGNDKNIALVVGNLISLYARQGFTAKQAMHGLAHCGIWNEIAAYYRARGIHAAEFRQLLHDKLIERRMLGRAA